MAGRKLMSGEIEPGVFDITKLGNWEVKTSVGSPYTTSAWWEGGRVWVVGPEAAADTFFEHIQENPAFSASEGSMTSRLSNVLSLEPPTRQDHPLRDLARQVGRATQSQHRQKGSPRTEEIDDINLSLRSSLARDRGLDHAAVASRDDCGSLYDKVRAVQLDRLSSVVSVLGGIISDRWWKKNDPFYIAREGVRRKNGALGHILPIIGLTIDIMDQPYTNEVREVLAVTIDMNTDPVVVRGASNVYTRLRASE